MSDKYWCPSCCIHHGKTDDCFEQSPQKVARPVIQAKEEVWLMDTLYNCSVDCVTSLEMESYGKGIYVGVASTLMAMTGCTLQEALGYMDEVNRRGFGRRDIHLGCIPESWRERK